jgi:hypothetical protein
MVTLQEQGEKLQVSAYPRSRSVVVKINSNTVAAPASVTCDNGDTLTPSTASGYWQLSLRGRKYCSWNGTLP